MNEYEKIMAMIDDMLKFEFLGMTEETNITREAVKERIKSLYDSANPQGKKIPALLKKENVNN